jgi:hypothetical protein
MNEWKGSRRERKERLSYPWSHLLPPLLVFCIVRLTKDIIFPILDPRGVVVPIGAFIARLVVYMHPYIGGGRNEHTGSYTGDRT